MSICVNLKTHTKKRISSKSNSKMHKHADIFRVLAEKLAGIHKSCETKLLKSRCHNSTNVKVTEVQKTGVFMY